MDYKSKFRMLKHKACKLEIYLVISRGNKIKIISTFYLYNSKNYI